MKANEAPEKIYVTKCMLFATNPEITLQGNGNKIEYTRTDVFIEKACDWLNNNLAKYSELTNEDEYGNKLKETVMNVFYGQAVKDFQNYMKGE